MYSPSTVDTRESNAIIWRSLVLVGWKRGTLSCGDFCIPVADTDVVLIERKTIPDLISCIKDGTMMRQARRLVDATKWPILLVEGSLAMASDGTIWGNGISWEALWNYLQTLQDLGLRLQLTGSVAHTVVRVVELERYYQKDMHESLQREPSGNLGIATLGQVKGVGPSRAKSLLAALPTLLEVAQAEPEALAIVPGLPGDVAYRVYRFWRHSWK